MRTLVSLSYDGGLADHRETVVPDLDQRGLRGSFYMEPTELLDQLDFWRGVSGRGHEIGNGALIGSALPDGSLPGWSVEMVLEELEMGGELLRELLPGREFSIGLPWGKAACGDTEDCSLAIAERFGSVRTGMNGVNKADTAEGRLLIVPMVGLSGEQMVRVVEEAQESGAWVILSFAGVGTGEKSVDLGAHRELLDYLVLKRDGVSVLPVADVVSRMRLKSSFRVV